MYSNLYKYIMTIWQKKIKALGLVGWGISRIAREVGVSIAAVSELKQGRSKEPRFTTAMRINALYEQEVGQIGQKRARRFKRKSS